jgi:hypothetical protein
MYLIRQYRSLLLFAGFVVVCSLMVIRQVNINQNRHVELREAFILLQTRGYRVEAGRLFQRLLKDMQNQSDRSLREDFQRTMTLVDPARQQPENLIWVYHWTVSNELERRSEASLKRALKLADQT